MFRTLILTVLTLTLLASAAFAAQKITVASDGTWPPMEYLDNQKNIIGYSSDYIRAVAKEAGFEVDVRNVAWDGIFAGVAAGNYDVVASSVTITPERQKAFDFSDPYYEVRQAVVVQKGTDIKDLQGLKDKTVGGQIGTTGIFVAEKAKTGAKIKEYEDVGLAMQDLGNGRIDAVICDDPVALYYANKRDDFADKLQVAFITDDVEHYGFTIQKGRKDLVEMLNKGIKAVKEKGIDKELTTKWMGGE